MLKSLHKRNIKIFDKQEKFRGFNRNDYLALYIQDPFFNRQKITFIFLKGLFPYL